MQDSNPVEDEFLSQLTSIVEANLANEQFGVSELADEMHMSRSNLLRRVKKVTNLSVSQQISQIRLKRAMEMLRKSTLNVSEVSLQVGFGSTSYFIKCFREHYGFPPGEAGKRSEAELSAPPVEAATGKGRRVVLFGAGALVLVLASGLLVYYRSSPSPRPSLEKSIAVLPFKNESNDSTNVYLINGLMESTLTNLQKIKDMKVVSRTSAEKYRNTSKSIPEMGRELNVSYFVEGSGQKIGDKILLNIQLIEAATDKHLWAKQYRRESKDIFELQEQVAKNIAEEIQALITPEEKSRIEKKPTENLIAYDLFLKGRDLVSLGGRRNIESGISFFKKAIEEDHTFAIAYADAAMAYYNLDVFQAEKKYSAEITSYANKAMALDSTTAESQVASALLRMHRREFAEAIPYLETALLYKPNSVEVVNLLADFYCNYLPNTTRYLEYALKGVRLDIASLDSATTSYNFLRLSNALMQSGFFDESLRYMDKCLEYNPKNPFAYVKTYILFAIHKDARQTRELLLKELNKDTTRIDVLQEVGKMNYMMGDYPAAYHYYRKFIDMKKQRRLDIYRNEDLKIAIVLARVGLAGESEEYLKRFKAYADNDGSLYKSLNLAAYYAYTGDRKKAIENMKLFSKEKDYLYWVLLMADDKGVEAIKDDPEFKTIMHGLQTKFWDNHDKIKVTLEQKGLL